MPRKILISVVLLFAFVAGATAQTHPVQGVVSDENGAPLAGAGVFIEGTTTGTLTDQNGSYSIRAKSSDIINFSFVGYETLREVVGKRKEISVSMNPDRQALEEVVVIGYGTIRKSDLTGAVSSIGTKEIEGFRTGNVLDVLGGQIAGVNVVSADGTPGAGFDVKIRGVGSVNGDSSPLYIVDGFEVDNISYLANQDIKSVEVLKDASASAIYGARAANGVILVTTREGRDGRSEVSYNGSATYRTISKRLEVMDPYDFVALQLELNPTRYTGRYFQSGVDADGNPWPFQSLDDYKNVAGIDWQSEAFHPAWSQSHDVSLVGGNQLSKYTVSYSHYDEDGIFQNSGFRKDAARVKFNQRVFRFLTLDASISYTNSLQSGVGTGGNTLTNVLQYRPTGGLNVSDEILRNNASDPILEELGIAGSTFFNPVLNAEKVDKSSKMDQWVASGSLNFQIVKGLTFKSSASFNSIFRRDDVFYRRGSQQAELSDGPYGSSRTRRSLRWSNANVLNYQNVFAKLHHVNLTLGHETTYELNEFLYGEARNFPMDNLGVDNLGVGALPSAVSSSKQDKRRLSFFTRAFYNYGDRYMLTATLRADASTVFSSSNKWGLFPSFAGAWTLSNEPWLRNVRWLSNLKLRVGWGIVGNDRIASYLSLDRLSPVKYGKGGSQTTVLVPARLPNEELRWEGAMTTNVGADVSLLKKRVNLTVDAFIKDSKDLLLARDLPLASGFASQWQNVGQLRNKGIELTLSTVNINSRHFSWTTDFNLSFVRNSLVSLSDGASYLLSRSGFNSNFSSYDYIAEVGAPVGSMYGYIFDGVYQSSDFFITPEGASVLKPGIPDISQHAGESVAPGFIKYKDMDGDGIITTDDRTIIGNGQPDFYGGLTNRIQYRGFDLSLMFQFSVGADVYNAQRMMSTQSRMESRNFLKEVSGRWTSENASNTVPSAKGYVAYDVTSRFIEDGSFLRLKNFVLGYTVPSHLSRKILLSHLRVYFSGSNLFCLNSYSGFDPEVNILSGNLMPSFDFGSYPRNRAYTLGVEIKF